MLEQTPQPQPAFDPAKAQEFARLNQQNEYARRMKSGANNFYWVAALSVINSLLTIFSADLYFVVGLGATLVVDGIASGLAQELGGSTVVVVIGFLVSLFFAGVFASFGFFAGRKHTWAFIVGMVLYVFDTLLMLAFQEWLGVAFHALFLFGIWGGFQALRKLKAIEGAGIIYAVPPAETMR